MSHQLEVLVDDAIYPEAPRWHDGAFWFSDIGASEVCRVAADGVKRVAVGTIAHPSGLGWTRSGELVVVSMLAGEIYKVGAGNIPQVLCGPDRHGTEGLNDMATVGCWSYVTCSGMHYDPNAGVADYMAPAGKILQIDHETGAGRIVASGLIFPNGIVITPDGQTLLVNEVFASRVTKFDITADGALTPQGVYVPLSAMPDGLALDAEGAVWVGTDKAFQHVDRSGNLLAEIEVPGWRCIACTLGGPDGRTLYLAVSQFDGAESIFTKRSKGQILTTRVDVPAAAEPHRR